MSPKTAVIQCDPEILGGTPVFVGTRVPAQTLFDYLEVVQLLQRYTEGLIYDDFAADRHGSKHGQHRMVYSPPPRFSTACPDSPNTPHRHTIPIAPSGSVQLIVSGMHR